MSQENVELMRAFLEDNLARVRSDFDPETTVSKMAEAWDPGIELDASEGMLELSGVYRGIDAVQQWWRDWYAVWETLQFEYELVDAGDRVVMLLDLGMRGRSSGIEVPSAKVAWVSRLRDGLVVHVKLYGSHAEALKAVGVSE